MTPCNHKYVVVCRKCKQLHNSFLTMDCTRCSGLLDILYHEPIIWSESPYTFERYKPLLPIPEQFSDFDHAMQPSPLVRLTALEAKTGLQQIVGKWEGANPTGSVKDREALCSLALLISAGIRTIVMASTGNTATAYLTAINGRDDICIHVFVGTEFRERLLFPDHGSNYHIHTVAGTYDDATLAAAQFAKAHTFHTEGGFKNVGLREGQKTLFLESVDQLGNAPDWYFQAIGSAIGIDGCYKANTELLERNLCSKRTRLVAVQQAGCDPMVRAFQAGSAVWDTAFAVSHPTGLAKGILRTTPSFPYPYIYQDVVTSEGRFLSVTDEATWDAMDLIRTTTDLPLSPEAGIAVAGFLQMAEQGVFQATDTVLINLSGRQRATDPQ